jgi:hypothetical protein
MRPFEEIIVNNCMIITDDIIEMLGCTTNIFTLVSKLQIPYTIITYIDTVKRNFPKFLNLEDEIDKLHHQPQYHPKLAKYVRIDKTWIMLHPDNFIKFIKLCPEVSQEIKDAALTATEPMDQEPMDQEPIMEKMTFQAIEIDPINSLIHKLIQQVEDVSLTDSNLKELDLLVKKLEDLRLTAYTKSFESKGEQECRRIAEAYTGKLFSKARPDFLKNEVTGDYKLELDCFNEELKIGIEYQGIQHYKYIERFHHTKDAFQNGKYRDYMKKQLCKENGIHLIEIPYTLKLDKIGSVLVNKIDKILKKRQS